MPSAPHCIILNNAFSQSSQLFELMIIYKIIEINCLSWPALYNLLLQQRLLNKKLQLIDLFGLVKGSKYKGASEIQVSVLLSMAFTILAL